MDHSDQLKGQWSHDFNGIKQFIEFTPQQDHISGRKGFISGNDTTILEHLSIKQIDGKWLYEFTDLESEITTSYPLSTITEKELSFQNNQIEWPRNIKIISTAQNQMSLKLMGDEDQPGMKDVTFDFNHSSK